jgi:hypothetical protein
VGHRHRLRRPEGRHLDADLAAAHDRGATGRCSNAREPRQRRPLRVEAAYRAGDAARRAPLDAAVAHAEAAPIDLLREAPSARRRALQAGAGRTARGDAGAVGP